MRIWFFLGILCLVVGCNTLSIAPHQEVCDGRSPAGADLCAAFISSSTSVAGPTKVRALPSERELLAFFTQLKAFIGSLEALYEVAESKYLEPTVYPSTLKDMIAKKDPRRPFASISTSQVLAQRRTLNEKTSKVLMAWSYREVRGGLFPPRDLMKLYQKIYQTLVEAAATQGVPPEDVILPALAFVHGQDIQFVRPGIDPIPKISEGWKLLRGDKELSYADFSRMIRERKMLLEPSMLFHDVGHIVDLALRPHYMSSYIRYHEARAEAAKKYGKNLAEKAKELGPVAYRGDLERYFNEFLYLPSIENLPEISKLIPNLKIDQMKSLQSLQAEYSAQSESELLQTVNRFLTHRYELFSSHGGGSRDWSLDRRAGPVHLALSMKHLAARQPITQTIYETAKSDQQVPSNFDMDRAYLAEEAPTLFLNLEQLLLLKDGKVVAPEISEFFQHYIQQNAFASPKAAALQLISFHLAEIEYRIQSALHFKVTPEGTVQDTALLYEPNGWQKYLQTQTYQYYSTYRKYTVQWYLAVDIARALRP